MNLLQLLVVVSVLGLLVWLVMFLPIPEPFRTVAIVIALLNAVGLLPLGHMEVD